ncbi:MAG: DNA repair protein RecO [Spirochaeta sp. LUC14_002_19_P3]|nr:MAG: DNA repair protein RecO [Spirochaeta sp. LUC14_002_19_P3]
MSRNIKAPALVLKMNPVGENHRGLAMLTAGEGLLRPIAYGAQSRRSALRASAVPFNTGIADMHYDSAKDRWRLTAFDALDTHDGLRENLDRFYIAAAWAEVLLNSHGSGEDSHKLYGLAAKGLTLLSTANEEAAQRLKTGFFWHFLAIEGVKPDISRCGRCTTTLGGRESARFWPNGLLLCPQCSEKRGMEISDGARAWLERIAENLDDAVKIGLHSGSIKAAERWVMAIIQSLLEKPLKTLPLV